mmetsp:Transcript_11704/g.26781  ORF Transcript_11704/g.26781 Transcript_11704/m.26781 type:complete len:205 (+) Transcript_11704:125-739(+)
MCASIFLIFLSSTSILSMAALSFFSALAREALATLSSARSLARAFLAALRPARRCLGILPRFFLAAASFFFASASFFVSDASILDTRDLSLVVSYSLPSSTSRSDTTSSISPNSPSISMPLRSLRLSAFSAKRVLIEETTLPLIGFSSSSSDFLEGLVDFLVDFLEDFFDEDLTSSPREPTMLLSLRTNLSDALWAAIILRSLS